MSSTRYWRVILEPEEGVWETCRDKEIIAVGYPKVPNHSSVKKFRDEMKIGDKIVAYLKGQKIGAVGTVIGDYSIDQVIFRHNWRTRKVQWNHKSLNGWKFPDKLGDNVKATLGQRTTVVELTKDQYKKIEKQILSL